MSYWTSYDRQPASQYTSGVQHLCSSSERLTSSSLSSTNAYTQYQPQSVYYGPGSPVYPSRYSTSTSVPTTSPAVSTTSATFQISGAYSSSYTNPLPTSTYVPLSYTTDTPATIGGYSGSVGLPLASGLEPRVISGGYQSSSAIPDIRSSRAYTSYHPISGQRRTISSPPRYTTLPSTVQTQSLFTQPDSPYAPYGAQPQPYAGSSAVAGAPPVTVISTVGQQLVSANTMASIPVDSRLPVRTVPEVRASQPITQSTVPVTVKETSVGPSVKVLQVNTSAKLGGANSTKLADMITAKLKSKLNVTDFKLRDLAVNPHPIVDDAFLTALGTPAEQRTPQQKNRVALDDKLIEEVQATDIIVLGVPMYNFHVSTQCKSWVDAISRAGVTFRYSSNGPEGLIKGKKVYAALARGGAYRGKEEDQQVQWLRKAFSFLGITDIHFVYAEGLAMGGDEGAAKSFKEAEEEINRII